MEGSRRWIGDYLLGRGRVRIEVGIYPRCLAGGRRKNLDVVVVGSLPGSGGGSSDALQKVRYDGGKSLLDDGGEDLGIHVGA